MRILVVDDDRRLCNIIKRGLLEETYAVDLAYDGEEGEYMAEINPYDLIILDIMMPRKDGIEVCRGLRSKRVNTPVLMLTAKDSIEDRVKGLDAGADDYLVKPFAFNELLARIRALLRREGMFKSTELEIGGLVLNTLIETNCSQAKSHNQCTAAKRSRPRIPKTAAPAIKVIPIAAHHKKK